MKNPTSSKARRQVRRESSNPTSEIRPKGSESGPVKVPASALDPLDYDHPHVSMLRYAEVLRLRFDCQRTRHAYYRQLRLLSEYTGGDPARITEEMLRDYFLHVTRVKGRRPKSVRQAAACARIFFVDLLGHSDWTVFSQIRARDQERLPEVLTRAQVIALLVHVRMRRYRIPLKLIYCCGLRISECLNLTVDDILGDESKLIIRKGKGGRDRMVPISSVMVEDLRRYWSFHRHPRLLFPNVGRGSNEP